MTDPGPVLVLGATSLIGGALVDLEDRPPLVCVSRRATAAARAGDRWLVGDIAEPGPALDAVVGVKAALGLAPIWVVAPAVDRLARLGVRRIVAFSSTSRWTKTDSPEPSERTVAERLARAEDAFIASSARLDIAWTILRPTLIYREGHDGNVSRLAGLIRRLGVLPLAGRGAGLRQPVHAQDLALGALEALNRPQTIGKAYDLPGGETLSYREMAERVFVGLGRRPRVLNIPPALWTLGFRAASVFLPGATAAMGARMEVDLAFDASEAERDLSWRPRPFQPRFPERAVPPGRR